MSPTPAMQSGTGSVQEKGLGNLAAHGRPAVSAAGIFDAIRRIEARACLDGADWMAGDLPLWPLYRMELYRAMFAHQTDAARASTRPGGLAARLRPAFARNRRVSATVPGALWLVSDGISFTRSGAVELEKFCAPLWHACQALGRQATVVDRGSVTPRASLEPMDWQMPQTARAKLMGLVGAALRPDARHGRLVARLRQVADDLRIELPPLSPRRFDAMTRAVLRLAHAHHRRMLREKPAAVMLVCWYDVGGYAYVLAAARAGIAVMDLQHGVTGRYHAGYSGWDHLPPSVLRLLPTHFWTWSAADAAVIDGWGASTGRRALCGGHPLMQAWAAGLVPLGDAMQVRMDRLLADSRGRVRVLVTLQPGLLSADALGPFIDACRMAPDVAWWLRLHPMAFADAPVVEKLMRESQVLHWNIADASDLPLPALLAASDVHATHSSSAVIEAAALGVPSVVWSAYGGELFKDTTQAGLLCVAAQPEPFVRALVARPSVTARASSGGAAESMPQLRRTLATFLESLE